MLEIFSEVEMFFVLITFLLLLCFIAYYVYKKRSDCLTVFKKLKVIDYILIALLISLRITTFVVLDAYEDPFDGASAQNWSYKCQARIFASDIAILEKSQEMINCHVAHAMLFGINLGLLFLISGNFSSLNGIILNLVLSIISAIVIYIFLIITHNCYLKRTISFFCSIVFLFTPLLFFESSYSSVQYFGSIFILLFFVFFYVFVKRYDKQNEFDNILFAILFLLMSCISNIKFEYALIAFGCWLLIFIFMLKRIGFKRIIRTVLGRQRIYANKEKQFLKYLIILSLVVLFANLHIFARSQTQGTLPKNPFGLKEIERNFGYMLLGDFSPYQINSLLLTFVLVSIFLLKKSILKMFYYYGYIITMLFYYSFAPFHTFCTTYLLVIMISFLIPFILFHKNNIVKILILSIIVISFLLFRVDYAYDFNQKSNVRDCLNDLSFIYPPEDIFVGGWVYFDQQMLLEFYDPKIKDIGYNIKSKKIIENKYYFWYLMGYELDPRTFWDCKDVEIIPKSCIDMNRGFLFKKC